MNSLKAQVSLIYSELVLASSHCPVAKVTPVSIPISPRRASTCLIINVHFPEIKKKKCVKWLALGRVRGDPERGRHLFSIFPSLD